MSLPGAERTPDTPFSFDELYRFPGDLDEFDVHRDRKRVAVLGAGIAGLVAAVELQKRGHLAEVFEASGRPGGRILTRRFSDDSHGEFGAMRIPANHHCTLHYVQEFALKTRRFVNNNEAGYFYFRGRRTRLNAWSHVADLFNLKLDERRDPLALYEGVMNRGMVFLSSADKWSMFTDQLTNGRLRDYEEANLFQYLNRWLSPEAISYVGHATGMLQYEKAAFLETMIDYFGLFRVDQFELEDGMEALPRALADSLGGAVHYNAPVASISLRGEDGGVLVGFSADGERQEKEFDYAICTLPAPVLPRIRFDPVPAHQQCTAWRGVSYASASKTLIHCDSRPWEHDDGIFGGGSFTDTLIQQVWYPSDNAAETDSGSLLVGFTGDDADSPTRGYATAPRSYTAMDPARSHGPGVLTGAYMWERNSERFAALDDDQRTELVLRGLHLLHPTLEKSVVDVVHHCWGQQSSPGSGAFAYFGPGEHERYQPWLGEPYPNSDHARVFFAGEHLAIAHAWIQGAIQTALTAVCEVLRAPTFAGGAA
jgi:monoamine oxidase